MKKQRTQNTPAPIAEAGELDQYTEMDVSWMDTFVGADRWRLLNARTNSYLHIDFNIELALGFRLTDASLVTWRKLLIDCTLNEAAVKGYGPSDGYAVYCFCFKFMRLFSWWLLEGLNEKAISAAMAVAYASHLVGSLPMPDRPIDSGGTGNEQDSGAQRPGAELVADAPASIVPSVGYSNVGTSVQSRTAIDEGEDSDDFFDEEDVDFINEVGAKNSPETSGLEIADGITASLIPDVTGEKPSNGPISQNYLCALLQPFQAIWDTRTKHSFNLEDEPLPGGANALARRFADKTSPRKATSLVPLEMGVQILRGAWNWVEHITPLLIDYTTSKSNKISNNLIKEVNKKLSEQGFKYQVVRKPDQKNLCCTNVISITTAIEVLTPHAVYVICSSFTLARPGEISSLPAGSITGTIENGFWGARYIEKNYRQVKNAPVHPYVTKSISHIEMLYGERRNITGLNRIFLTRPAGGENFRLKTFDSPGLNLLAKVIGAEHFALGDAGTMKLWHFVPRQFRRFAAALWAYRFDLPVSSLSVAMFHFSFVVTNHYLNNQDFLGWSAKYSRRLTLDVIEAAAAGSRDFAGQQTKRYRRLVARLRVNMQVPAGDIVKNIASRVVRDAHLIANPTAWGFCLCPSGENNIRRAACNISGTFAQMPDGRPDSTASSAGTCCGCRFFVTKSNRVPYLKSELAKCTRAAQNARGELEKQIANKKVIFLTQVCSDLESV